MLFNIRRKSEFTEMNRALVNIAVCIVVAMLLKETGGYQNSRGSDDYPDYQLGVRYDEYPLIVPKKRTALLVNRLMVALKKAMEDDEREEALKNGNSLDRYVSKSSKNYPMPPDDIRSMDLQRRGHGNMAQQKGRLYWRCYFNAVTCF